MTEKGLLSPRPHNRVTTQCEMNSEWMRESIVCLFLKIVLNGFRGDQTRPARRDGGGRMIRFINAGMGHDWNGGTCFH
jgi:hypothetical protein